MWGLSLTHWTFIEDWICLAALQQDKICKLWHKMPAKVIAGIKCLSKILDLKQKHLKTKFWPKILEQELSTCVRCIFFPLGWTLPPSLKKGRFQVERGCGPKNFSGGSAPGPFGAKSFPHYPQHGAWPATLGQLRPCRELLAKILDFYSLGRLINYSP